MVLWKNKLLELPEEKKFFYASFFKRNLLEQGKI